ncbi:hypothetical protein GGR28_003352 [Lewinella aquimaris]|uniref:Uncharacterized protein n=1 Tax=Neolewinella aquimaris TaxID=1835722 RepID=A0A840EB97_9BACT|nr:hypothetical protein [Neolewinella aquimaris]MBB4080717.1 hypothetical protein [Neolewinella aquimaris]
MRILTVLLLAFAANTLFAQEAKPSYCEEAPATYGTPGEAAPSLPKFATTPTKEYKVQVAILRYTDPAEYPFHPSLVARFRPCEQVWVVESRESFVDREQAVALQETLREAGYGGSYITDLVAYQ